MPSEPYRLAQRAHDDLDRIWDHTYSASISYDIANRVVEKITAAFEFLCENPGAGHLRQDLNEQGFKFWNVYSYLIVYNADSSPIEIVAVLHGGRDVPAVLDEP